MTAGFRWSMERYGLLLDCLEMKVVNRYLWGVSTSPSQAAALSSIEPSHAGVASGALSTMRYAGGVIGSGLVALLAASPDDPRLWVFPGVLFASALAALWLTRVTKTA